MTEAVQVFVDDVPLSTLCIYSGLSWTSRWPGGDYDASWTAQVPQGWRHRAFVRGARVEIRFGGMNTWAGCLSEFDRDTGQMACDGLIRRGEDYDAIVPDVTTGDPVATWSLSAAVDEAITPTAFGRVPIGWTSDASVAAVPRLSGATQSTDVLRLDELLALARARGYGTEYLGSDGVLRLLPDPTTPTWFVRPTVVEISEAAGVQRATNIFVAYMLASGLSWVAATSYSPGNIVTFNGDLWERVSSGAGDIPEEGSIHWAQLEVEPWDPSVTSKTFSTGTHYTLKDGTFYRLIVAAGPDVTVSNPPTGWTNLGTLPTATSLQAQDTTITPYREERVDALALGDLSFSDATAIAGQALATALAPSFTTDIPATPLTVTDAHMQPINPVLLRAGTLGRIWGASHPRLMQGFTDVIAGEVTVSDAESDNPTALIKPFGKQPQSDIEVMEAALNARRRSA